MNWKQLKEQYALFKQWQQQPVKFENVEDEHCCHCCGMTYTGNYCPCCSQKADQGRINWQSVRRGVMDIWGLGSRSLPYSILQLLFRPGYFIRDYISGKRQVSFPPVKMLFIVAVIYSFLFYWIYPEILHIELIAFDKETAEVMPFVGWIRKYFSWMSLLTSFLYLLPTWLLFRHAPRYPSHTLPEGFFIQVLMSVLLIVVDVICKIICGRNVMLSSSLLIVLLVIYYYVAYRQLFGYGVWGTIWRQLLMWLSIIFLIFGALFLSNGIVMRRNGFTFEQQMGYQVGFAVSMFICSAIVLVLGYVLNRIASRKTRKQQK